MDDPFDLRRFVDAQAAHYAAAVAELRAGRKRSHWMWFVLPQIAGLGKTPTSRFYAIASRAEAAAYLAHPVLGRRLREAVGLVNAIEGRSARQIFGAPDDLKFRSCVTLFAAAGPDDAVFRAALDKYYGGAPDAETLRRL